MISERTLKKWRKEALKEIEFINTMIIGEKDVNKEVEHQQRILHMTQELLDQHLIRR